MTNLVLYYTIVVIRTGIDMTITSNVKKINNDLFNCTLSEYQYQQQLSTRIDNKSYIALTICGALFAFITNNICFSKLFCKSTQLYIIISFLLLLSFCTCSIILFITAYKLICILKAHNYCFINISMFINNSHDSTELLEQMAKCIKKNGDINDTRLAKVNNCYTLIIALIIICVIIFILAQINNI